MTGIGLVRGGQVFVVTGDAVPSGLSERRDAFSRVHGVYRGQGRSPSGSRRQHATETTKSESFAIRECAGLCTGCFAGQRMPELRALRCLTLELSWDRRCDAGPAPCRIAQSRAPARWRAVGPQLERRVRPRPCATNGRHALPLGLKQATPGNRGPSRAMLTDRKMRPRRPQPNTDQ